MIYKYDFLIIGAGVAGMSYALKVARAKKGKVCMICKTSLDEANTSFAQGGVASVTNLELDNFDKHIEDTMIAGDFISDPKAVEQVIKMAPSQIKELVNWGVNFDKKDDGTFDLHREGGHSEFRILHHADDTGAEIQRGLMEAVRNCPDIEVNSIGLRDGLESAGMEIRDLIEDYELHTKRLEQINDLIKKLCLQIKYAEKLLEIKGIGITTVAGFIAEVGDITRFDNAKELQKLAGLELVSDDSGKHRGRKRISKRGRCKLRYLLFQAAISVVGKNEEFSEIHHYYTTREKNPLKKMQSLIAVACKLIRVFYAVLTKGTSYNASKMLEDIRRPGSGLQAA